MLDVPFGDAEESLARRRYEECQQRREAAATTPDEHARRAEACVETGTFALAFDTAREAHDAFGDAADAYLDSVEGRIADPVGTDYAALPLHTWRGAYAALLAGDRHRARAFADAVEMSDQEPEPGLGLDGHPYWYARAVAAAAAGDDEAASAALEETHPGNPWAVGTTAMVRGAVESDRGAVETGLDDLLERHRERVTDIGRRELHATVFAAEATALTLLAWERGAEYDPESRFVPSSFLWETLPRLS
ncbi:MAG: hypothetical protein ABEH90_10815 [Halolamina sp.]